MSLNQDNRIFLYTISRDYGFAPNPFGNYCTLATCKPQIREIASVGDWVVGIDSLAQGRPVRIIYAMEVTRKMTFQEYWNHMDFLYKRPVMNGSMKTMYGDNIYHEENDKWVQENSHHSLENGSVNMENFNKDLSSRFVLISNHFYYFGNKAPLLPHDIVVKENISHGLRSYKYASKNIIRWIEANFRPGYNGDPIKFNGSFERYDGVS